MNTFNSNIVNILYQTNPDQFAIFNRGDRVVCLEDISVELIKEWVLSEENLIKDEEYLVRDYHWGMAADKNGTPRYGQIINLEGFQGKMLPFGEFGFHQSIFRKA